ncbi:MULTISPECIES: hypothetical protein [Pelotomaculum]|uniref:hypothetical protein n=1 Tax=Pelotomaculum TaxID=191373 RepID=UPI00167DEBFC|nr:MULTISPECIES: hypothetical protein [Pelotomaculum]
MHRDLLAGRAILNIDVQRGVVRGEAHGDGLIRHDEAVDAGPVDVVGVAGCRGDSGKVIGCTGVTGDDEADCPGSKSSIGYRNDHGFAHCR